MSDVATPVITIPEGSSKREAIFRAALERIRSMQTAGHLRVWVDRELEHQLYRIPASSVRDAPVGERVPSSLMQFVLQFFLPLVTEDTDLFPEEARAGPNLLSSASPIQGILSPAVVHGKAPSGEPRSVAGALLVPGLVSIPAHVSRIEGAAEVLVYFGTTALTAAFYDASDDTLVLDVTR